MSVLVTLGLAHLSMMIECIIFMILFQSLQPAPQGIALALTPITNANVYTAANLWVSNEAQARSEYGDISEWDVSAVTSLDFSKSAFTDASNFNGDLSKWNTSKVSTLYQ
eukprot:g1443.t1